MEILKTFEKKLVEQEIPRKLTPNTIRTYKAGLNIILDLFETNNLEFITKPEETLKKLESEYSNNDNTFVGKINIIMKVINIMYPDNKEYEEYYNKYKNYRDLLSQNIKEQYQTFEPSLTQVLKHTSINEDQIIENSLLKLVKRSINNKIDILALRNFLLYKTLNEAETRGDICLSKLVIHKCNNVYDDSFNYLIINKKNRNMQYRQTNYKTKDKHGKITHDINNELLYKLYNKLYNAYKKLNIEGGFAFYNEDMKTPMNTNTLSVTYTRFGTKYINKPISIQVMRVEKNSNTIDINDLEIRAKKQGHTIETGLTKYTKKNFKKE